MYMQLWQLDVDYTLFILVTDSTHKITAMKFVLEPEPYTYTYKLNY